MLNFCARHLATNSGGIISFHTKTTLEDNTMIFFFINIKKRGLRNSN